MKNSKSLMIVLAISLLSCINISAQEVDNKIPINFYLGASYTIAPSFDINGRWTVNTSTSANFYSIFADLVINQNLIGRAQVSFLSISSLSDELSNDLDSGFQMNGSLGYNYQSENNNKLSIPIMATIGYASVSDGNARDPGMQVGATIGLNYALSEKINASSSFRYLRGLKFNDGSPISQLDISIGFQLRIL